jgi:acyl dehydratase
MSFRFMVEEGKVAEFAKAVRDDNPAHRDLAAAEEQGFAGIPAPLTFVAASAHWRRGPNPLAEQNLDLTRTLHGESEWEYARPLLAGEELTVHQELAGIEEKQGRRGGTLRIYTLENRYDDASGQTVVTERWRLIETAKTVEA